jgi:V-type H+-transporting ATPase subunit a
VNTYGIPLYKEINPALFTCVTFPFLFGIMFGDLGHGLVLFFIGLMMCIMHPCLKRRAPEIKLLLKMRYMILLLGVFATFCGLIYNDMMSIPLYIFESCYDPKTKKAISNECLYPIGVDPIWFSSKNELQFMNSLKMKVSVILGILQMSLGVFLKAVNANYFSNTIDMIHEFIP